MKVRSSGTSHALVHRAERLGARRTDADLLEHAAELVRQRAGHRGRRALERLLEPEAGLHRDHEQVEDIGKLAEISFWRSSILRLISTSGYMNEVPQSIAIHDQCEEAAESPTRATIDRVHTPPTRSRGA